MKKVVLSIDGMTCSACSNGLEKYLNKLVSSSIISKFPLSKSSLTQVYKWFSNMWFDKLLIEFSTADSWIKTSLQYLSSSIIFFIPFICPSILFSLSFTIFFSSFVRWVCLWQQFLSSIISSLPFSTFKRYYIPQYGICK